MKKFIKLILVLVLVGVIVFFGFSFLSNKINLKNLANNIGNIINNGNDKPVEDKTNGNGDFKNTSIAVEYNELSAKDKEEILPQIKSEIAKDDIENTYTKLFENKTYTNSNFKYELNKDMISFGSWIQFEKDFYTQFENAIARGENFLMYSTYDYYNTVHQKTGSTPLIYGYIDGLGYLIGIKNGNVLEFAIENKYYSKIITYYNSERPQGSSWIRLDNTYDVLTLKSNQDIVKFPVGINDAKNETIYSDYKENVLKTTARGFFKDTHYWDFDYGDYQGYCFYEGNFMNITGKDKAYHLYGMGNYRVQTTKSMTYDENGDAIYHADKDFEFFWSGDNLGGYFNNTKYMTDFNNFFVSFGQNQGNSYGGDVNYAMFGEVADVYLKQIVNLMFSSEIKECNNFENENDLKVKEEIDNDIQTMHVTNSFEELFWTIEDEPSNGYKNNFFYPNDTETAKYYSKGEFLGNKAYDTAVPKKYTCNGKWYESLSEENKPYIISYVVFHDKLTIRHWKREWVGSIYYHIDLEENTIVLDEPVKETFIEFAHKLLDGKYTVEEYESGGVNVHYLIPDPEGRGPDNCEVFLEALELNEDITVVADETNIFNKHYNKTKTN